MEELAPEASGWLGTTAGVTADGRFIALARFDSAAAARQNSESAAQDKWWHEFSSLLRGEGVFSDSEDVYVDAAGDPNTAGFVQVIRGRVSDKQRVRELLSENQEAWVKFRPEWIGGLNAMYEDGTFTSAFYFTTEEEARVGESKEMPADLQQQMDELNALDADEPEFFDLSQPWLYSPR